MQIFFAVLGVVLICIVLWDAFETIVLPRRVTRKLRLTRMFYRYTWKAWVMATRLLPKAKRRESYLSFYGPLSLLLLLIVWAVGLIFGFALVHLGLGSRFSGSMGGHGFFSYLYMSGDSFFTIGLGDIAPADSTARVLTVLEGGMGFGFLALVIGYLPVIYQSFSRREVNISLLDARAGSPPSAAELLRRHSHDHGMEALGELLHEWERWSADLLESHLSYPVLAYFRSQHNNQSWLAALTTILDTSALTITGIEGSCQRQAELTFAMARHAVVDLAQIFSTPPRALHFDRLPADELRRLRLMVEKSGLRMRAGASADARLAELRGLYEPYVYALARHLQLSLPPWAVEKAGADNWQTSAWGRAAGFPVGDSPPAKVEEHF